MTVLAAAFATMACAQAQQAAPKQQEPVKQAAGEKVQQVEVKGSAQAYDPRRDDTASKIVVNNAEIVKYGDTNVLDVLKRLPGVTVSGGAVRMRGLGAGYTQFLVNGERPPSGFSLESLAPDSIERIEVMRAASAEFSTQSIAGTVNIVLKRVVSKASRELKAGAGLSRGLLSPSASLQLSDKAGAMSYTVSLAASRNRFEQDVRSIEENFDLARRRTMLRESSAHNVGVNEGINIGPRLSWTFANGDTLSWNSFANKHRFDMTSDRRTDTSEGQGVPLPDSNSRTAGDFEYARTDLNWVRKLGDSARIDIKGAATYSRNGSDIRRLAFNAQGDTALDSVTLTGADEIGYTTTGKYSTPIGDGHAFAMGWDGGYADRDDGKQRRETGLPGAFPINSDEDFAAEVTRFAVYGQDEWTITKHLSVYLGARWEGIRTTSSGNTFATTTSRTGVWSPLFHTLYKLPGMKGDQVRFSVTRTYKAPSTSALVPRRFTALNNSVTEPDYQGNPKLQPELALGIDASYEHYWGEGALLSASVSMRKIEGYTRRGLILDTDGRWVSLPVNDGDAHTRGIELEAKFPLKAVMKDAPNVDLRASLSRNWSTVDAVPGPNNRLDSQTPFSATLGIDYKAGALTAGASYAFKNGGPVRISENLGSYTSVRRDLEVYAVWKFNPAYQLRVAVSNVLGQDYINDSTYADSFGSSRSRTVYPGPTVARATLEVKF
ncbi:TonB-dependent receptor plug domain-containing protein [Massilia sp. GCM10020059]|uniref:TonB-dependent receptor n=1 Tax=Massilia agrisoli TaxID=2892444 RepID=A0ABS8IYP2_9BURK|nr:TonB-dependent receptor [Massilia agrisoli]MCC6072310.1 TonB-dependent receptor [Massilia agrisoli]